MVALGEPEIAAHAEDLEIAPGVRVPVAVVGHLMALKLLASDDRRRPQDVRDIEALGLVMTQEDDRLAREAVELITARGFSRGRDLGAMLDELLALRVAT
jgi:predicted nucleotidyltransferase